MQFSEVEIEKAVKYVQLDLIDDFWPDVIAYKDYLSESDWWRSVDFDSYSPGETSYIDVPKPTLVLRPGHYIEFADRIYYQLLINRIAQQVDSQFCPQDINFGFRISDKPSKFFRDNIESWKKFKKKDSEYFEQNTGGFLLETDITAYFEHIKVERLTGAISRLGVDGGTIQKIEGLLMHWAEDGIGIPQGNGCSSFLGNAYLDELDKAMISEGYQYYRFVDDIRIFADDEQTLRRALQRLTQLLRPLNLHLAGGKTRIIDNKIHLDALNHYQDVMESINYSLDIGDYGEEGGIDGSLQEIWREAISTKNINKTVFRFCIARFRRIESDFPLEDILNKDLYDAPNIDLVSNYLASYINEERVQKVVINKLLASEYEYEMIYLLKLLSTASSLHFDISLIDKRAIYSKSNFLLTGYFFEIIAKFGGQGERTLMIADFNKRFANDPRLARYFMIASSKFPKADKEITQFHRRFPFLTSTSQYLLKTLSL